LRIQISKEELICLLFWYSVFSDNTEGRDIDRELFERLREFLSLDKEIPLKEFGISGAARYQPGEGPK
jgi:hypothetical protein